MSGRRRKIPDIGHASQHRRAAAERIAVNTKVGHGLLLSQCDLCVQVQGSAADLVKTAMVRVEASLVAAWPLARPLKWTRARQDWGGEGGRGAWLALQLHDELIYEVRLVAVY